MEPDRTTEPSEYAEMEAERNDPELRAWLREYPQEIKPEYDLGEPVG